MAKSTDTPTAAPTADEHAASGPPTATLEPLAAAASLLSPDVQALTTDIAGLGMRLAAEEAAPVSASQADITDELEKGGPALGSFLRAVGLAVADTQAALDATLVKTAKQLSETNIKVIAVFEQNLDENGNMTKGNPIIQELPLINYLMPTAYAFSQVHLTADMDVSEFNAANGFNIKKSSFSVGVNAKASYGLAAGGFSASGGMNMDYSNDSTNVNASMAQDRAAGKLHMEATLEPRSDVQLPRPFIIQRGPRLRLMVSEISDVEQPADGETPAKVIGRKAIVVAELTTDAGQPLSGKTLQVTCDQPTLSYTASGATGAADPDKGKLKITIERKGANFDPKANITGTVRVWMNLVSATIPITL
jgi:hypothetical protein